MAAPNLKNKHFEEVKRLHFDEGMTLVAIGKHLELHPVTLSKWLKSEGLEPRQRGYTQEQTVRAVTAGDTKVTKSCRYCGTDFEDYEYRKRAFCSRDCTNNWQRDNATGTRMRRWCPCGNEVEKNPYQNKYCSPECRLQHGKKRQADPANHVTFTCQNCGKEVTRRKSLGYHKYCSNACASRHTKTRKFYAVEDFDIVFESSWETLFWGLCMFRKVPIERFDRADAVEWKPGQWYAPDFFIPIMDVAVEIKGNEDPNDQKRWGAFRATGRRLAVIAQDELNAFLAAPDLAAALDALA